MFWGMNEEWWQVLWGGVIGAAVAAIVGGLVAYMVVVLSNRHQTKLAEQALEESRKQAQIQLDEQRNEAAKAREIEAIAGFLTSAEKLCWIDRDDVDPTLVCLEMAAAVMRLRLSHPSLAALADILAPWPYASARIGNIIRNAPDPERLNIEEMQNDLVDLFIEIRQTLPRWSFAEDASDRQRVQEALIDIVRRTIQHSVQASEKVTPENKNRETDR